VGAYVDQIKVRLRHRLQHHARLRFEHPRDLLQGTLIIVSLRNASSNSFMTCRDL